MPAWEQDLQLHNQVIFTNALLQQQKIDSWNTMLITMHTFP